MVYPLGARSVLLVPPAALDVAQPRAVVIRRARVPIPMCCWLARMKQSGPLAGASRRPSTVADIEPQAGGRAAATGRDPGGREWGRSLGDVVR